METTLSCVLLVDDEPMIRKAGERILIRAGCRVMTASNGQEALELYVARKKEIDLVILDVTMPVMDGLTCLSALIRFDPHVQVVLSSGFNNKEMAHTLGKSVIGILPKPYGIKELTALFQKNKKRKTNDSV